MSDLTVNKHDVTITLQGREVAFNVPFGDIEWRSPDWGEGVDARKPFKAKKQKERAKS